MSYLSDIGQLKYKAESSFATNPTPDTYIPLKSRPDFSGLRQKVLLDETLKQEIYELAGLPSAAGLVDGEVTFEFYMHGFSSSIPSADPSGAHPLAELLAMVLGDSYIGGYLSGKVVAASSDTDTVAVSDGNSSSIYAGQYIGVKVGSSSYEGRYVQQTDGSGDPDLLELHPDADLSATPVDSSDVYGSITVFWTNKLAGAGTASANSVAFEWQGEAEIITLLGCRPKSATLTFTTGELPTCSITFAVAAGTFSGSPSASVQSYNYPDPEAFLGGLVLLTDASTARQLETDTVSLTIENDLQKVVDPYATYGISEWISGGGRKVTAQLTPLYSGTDLRDWHEAQTSLYMELSYGSQPGKLIGVRLPACHIEPDGYSPQQDRDGQIAEQITLAMERYTGDTDDSNSGECIDSNVSIGFA